MTPARLTLIALCAALAGACQPSRTCAPSTDPVLIPLDAVPPDACLELFGPGPCRPHGAAPTSGWTGAVAGPPPAAGAR